MYYVRQNKNNQFRQKMPEMHILVTKTQVLTCVTPMKSNGYLCLWEPSSPAETFRERNSTENSLALYSEVFRWSQFWPKLVH